MRCSICGEQIQGNIFTWWRQSHYRSLHADYARWFSYWARSFYGLMIPLLLAAAIVAYAWVAIGGVFVLFAGVVVVLFMGFCLYEITYVLRTNIRMYARKWQEDQNHTRSVQL